MTFIVCSQHRREARGIPLCLCMSTRIITCRCNAFALLSIACAAACACDYKQRKKSGRTSSAPLPGPPPFLRPLVTKRDRIYPRINPSTSTILVMNHVKRIRGHQHFVTCRQQKQVPCSSVPAARLARLSWTTFVCVCECTERQRKFRVPAARGVH